MLLRSLETGIDDPTLLEIGDGVLIAAWDERDEANGEVAVAIDGIAAERCRAMLRLPLAAGERRTLLAFRVPGRLRGELSLDRDDVVIARTAIYDAGPRALERLLSGLDPRARARLLGFVFGVCRGTFRLAAHADFVAFASALAAASLSDERIDFMPRAHLTRTETLFAGKTAPSIGSIEAVYFIS